MMSLDTPYDSSISVVQVINIIQKTIVDIDTSIAENPQDPSAAVNSLWECFKVIRRIEDVNLELPISLLSNPQPEALTKYLKHTLSDLRHRYKIMKNKQSNLSRFMKLLKVKAQSQPEIPPPLSNGTRHNSVMSNVGSNTVL